jgi:manganese/zinc/iron transport system permease protein
MVLSPADIDILLVASVVALACALPGVFLILRRMAMMSDAISHSILLGIVLGFFVVRDLSSPFLVLAAAAAGVLTVAVVELVARTGLVREDAATGLVFPLFFSLGVILIAQFASRVHLDTDAVLLGEIAFAPFNRFTPFGVDIGPIALYVMGGILILNVLLIAIFYKELKVATFDPGLAAALGFSPALIHYGLMSMVSLTAVGAFDAVGSILVVALMVAPPAAAYMLTDRLDRMLVFSGAIGVMAAVVGYLLARQFDVSIGGMMATMAGVFFGLAVVLAPERGLISAARRRARQRWQFAQMMLTIHLHHHEDKPESAIENRVDHLSYHLRWSPEFALEVVRRAQARGWIEREDGTLHLTEKGRGQAQLEVGELA